MHPTVILEWPDVKNRFKSLVAGEWRSPHSPENGSVSRWKSQPAHVPGSDNWNGGNAEDMLRWLRTGFNPRSIIANPTNDSPDRKRRRIRYSEDEGDFSYERALAGEDRPYMQWEVKKSRPGMRVIVELDFVCNVSAVTIAEYGDWVASLLRTLEDQGYDLELSIAFSTRELVGYGHGRVDTIVNVKRPNEVLDFKAWSPWFCPTGFRMLGFTALSMTVDKVKGQHARDYGKGVLSDWGIDWDAPTRTMRIKCDSFSSEFPAEMMNRILAESNLTV